MTTLPSGLRLSIHTVDAAHGGPIGVARVDPFPDPPRVFVVAMGYGAFLEPFELQRFGVLARALRARVLVVETPGCSAAPSALRLGERRALLRADFGTVAARMLTAALSVDHTNRPHREIGLLGYSLGTSIVAAMASAARNEVVRNNLTLTSLVLVEPVANRRWSGRKLIRAMRTENTLIEGYLDTNLDVPGAVLPADRIPGAPTPHQRPLDQLLLSNALRAGHLMDEVRAAAAHHEHLQVVIAHGASSHLSQPDAAARMVNQCRRSGIGVEDVTVPGPHGLWQSLPAVDDLGDRIFGALQRAARCDR